MSTHISDHDRDELLAYLYGALDDDERASLEERLRTDDALRAALDAARAEQRLLGEAAVIDADDFQLDTQAARGRIFTLRGSLVAAAILVTVGLSTLGYREVQRSHFTERYPVVAVVGPTSFVPESTVEYEVTVTDLDGDGQAGTVAAKLVDGNGTVQSTVEARVDDDGRALLRFMPESTRPGEEYTVVFETEFARKSAQTVRLGADLRDTTRVITRIATDKPVYRPGDTIRMRGVALESLRLLPAGDVPLRMRLFDPRGGVVMDREMPSKTGVTAWEYELEENAAGGAYRLEIAGAEGDEGRVAPASIEVPVRAYRVPRLTFDIALDRDSYGPGDEGFAWVAVERVEGGAPAGAAVTTTLHVDGRATQTQTFRLDSRGALAVPFRIPTEVAEGRVRLSLSVDDLGSVEGHAKTVPVALGRVKVELFPEGGDLVAGLRSRVYFRATTPSGAPADLAFNVRGADGVVAAARTDVHGMGVFEITPDVGVRINLSATSPAGIEIASEFPQINERGVAMRALNEVTAAGAPVRVELTSSESGVHVVTATVRGTQVVTRRVELTADTAQTVELDLDASKTLGGVVRVTVTRADGSPIAERLVYREPARGLKVTPTTERARYGPRESVNVTVHVSDENGRPASAILGAHVVDEGVVAMASGDSIPMPLHFLLGMEVDELEDADLYAGAPGSAHAIDLLLGVQGWRRFAWKSADEFLADHPESGPRIIGVARTDLPVTVSNGNRARSAMRRDMRRVNDKAGATALLAGIAFLFFGGIVVGMRSVWLHRPFAAIGGFAVPTLLVGLVVTAVVMSNSGMPMTGGADMAVARAVNEAIGLPNEEIAHSAATDDWDAGSVDLVELEEEIASDTAGGGAVRIDELRKLLGRIAVADEEDADAMPRDGLFANDDEFAADAKKRDLLLILTREYVHRAAEWNGVREDFAEVLYWRPILITDENGTATFSFDTPDSVTRFRVVVEAHDGRGALGDGHMTFENRVLFYAEPKLPIEVAAGDLLDLPVSLVNDGVKVANVFVDVTSDSELLRNTVSEGARPGAQVAAGTRTRVTVPFTVGQGRGSANLRFTARTEDGREDISLRTVAVVPRGYPMTISKSGVVTTRATAEIILPDEYDRTSLRGGLRVYPSTLATLVDGLEGMLSEPGGCFEQASSTNYPNVLVLGYLQQSDMVEPAVAKRAQELLGQGYKLLTGYECESDGYEWFGADPGHEALTAYGLLEFADMAKVHDVDPAMLDRTRQWLLDRRDGAGGFTIQQRSLDTFGGAPKGVTEAYIVWALTEADPTTDVAAELTNLERRARESDDAYTIALAALALDNRSQPGTVAMLNRLATLQKPDGSMTGAKTSITSSSGINLDVETAALAALAFDRSTEHLANAEAAIRFILEQRQNGRFGATQATILALRALTAHAQASRTTTSDLDLEIFVNGNVVATRHVPAGTPGVLDFGDEVLPVLRAGKNTFEIRANGAEALPWAVTIGYHSLVPATDPACPVTVTTSLANDTVTEGASVDLTVIVSNTTDKPLAMTIARIGFPAGLEARVTRLDELKEAGEIDFYEVRPREVTLYWRGMRASQTRTITMDFAAAIPGRFEGPATSAYLYYADDAKQWSAPLALTIKAK